MERLFPGLIFAVLFSISVYAQTIETKCEVVAFVTDALSGVNIRAGAGLNFKIIKTLPKDEGQ